MRPEIEACVLRQCGSGRYGSGQSGSGRERARPARTLSPTDVDLLFEPAPPKDPTRVWFTAFVVGCCLVLAGWIVLHNIGIGIVFFASALPAGRLPDPTVAAGLDRV